MTFIDEKADVFCSVGDPFPDFKLKGVKDGKIVDVCLKDFKGKWFVVCSYPLDFTFVCPTEIKAFSRAYDDFRAINCDMFWFSIDSEYSHLKWVSEIGPLHFPLVSDMSRDLSSSLAVLNHDGITYRSTFIVDEKGIIRHISVNDLEVGRSVPEVMRLVQAFQTGGLCACDWQPGDSNLKPE